MEQNRECYRFVKRAFDDGILTSTVDATYIIHLEGNGRLTSIENQLQKYHPTNTVYILFNKGYKNCKKDAHITIPPLDLVDAFLQVFKHAQNEKYGNILILEDDFLFDDKINEPFHQENINHFLQSHENQCFTYFLGCIPMFQIPCDYYNYYVLVSGGMHSCIYSRSYRDKVLLIDQKQIADWDAYFNTIPNTVPNGVHYNYYIPLCYQLFPVTDNSSHWGSESTVSACFCMLAKIIIKWLNLDKSIEPGYSIVYALSKIIPIAILLLIIFVIYRQFPKKRKSQ